MKKFIDPFLYNVPKIDVHGYDRMGAVAMIRNFIDNYSRIGEKKLIIIHGKGKGILKEATHSYLKSDKRVLSYQHNNFNNGETIAILR